MELSYTVGLTNINTLFYLHSGLLVRSIVETLADAALNPEKRKLLAYSAVSIFCFKMEAVALCLVRLPHRIEAAEISAELVEKVRIPFSLQH